jgi:hypothetical protein
MENHKELFYMKLLEYEENLPKHYDKDKFVLSGLRYEAILNCLTKRRDIKQKMSCQPLGGGEGMTH